LRQFVKKIAPVCKKNCASLFLKNVQLVKKLHHYEKNLRHFEKI
jgi:hypothetical protein